MCRRPTCRCSTRRSSARWSDRWTTPSTWCSPRSGASGSPCRPRTGSTCWAPINDLIAADRMRPAFLFERSRVLHLSEADLRNNRALTLLDPDLRSVSNLNEPADYERAHALPAPEIVVERFGPLAAAGRRAAQTVNAWSLGEVAPAVGLPLDEHVVAALNGDQITRDPQLPLVIRRHRRVHGRRRGGLIRLVVATHCCTDGGYFVDTRCSCRPDATSPSGHRIRRSTIAALTSRCCAPISAAPDWARG